MDDLQIALKPALGAAFSDLSKISCREWQQFHDKVFKVGSQGTSEIALGQKGAELLLGKGHLLARLSGEPSLIYAQVPFISNDDAGTLVQRILQRGV